MSDRQRIARQSPVNRSHFEKCCSLPRADGRRPIHFVLGRARADNNATSTRTSDQQLQATARNHKSTEWAARRLARLLGRHVSVAGHGPGVVKAIDWSMISSGGIVVSSKETAENWYVSARDVAGTALDFLAINVIEHSDEETLYQCLDAISGS